MDENDVKPFPKELYLRGLALGISKVVLNFSGGSDEGYMSVNLYRSSREFERRIELNSFERQVEDWANENYYYNGAGDGSNYGDDICYDLIEKTVTLQGWWMTRTEGCLQHIDVAIGDGSDEEVA